jgi:hypothetical protein
METKLPDHLEELRDKILEGINLAFKKLVKEKAANDEELVFSEKGKVVRVKAKDLLIQT